jgi:uncharacterized membrane protein YfcA
VLITDPWFYIASTIAVLVVGIAKGGLGGGIGIVAVPLMSMVVSPLQAAAILLPLLMAMDALALRAYWRQWDWQYLEVLVPAALGGTVIGFFTAQYISVTGLRALVGIVALAYALQYFLPRTNNHSKTTGRRSAMFWGATAGFTSFSIHAGGPPLQAYLLQQRMDRTTFQATGVLFFFVVNWSIDTLLTSLVLLPIAPIGVSLGRHLHQRINDAIFFGVIHASLFLIGVKLLYDAVMGS